MVFDDLVCGFVFEFVTTKMKIPFEQKQKRQQQQSPKQNGKF